MVDTRIYESIWVGKKAYQYLETLSWEQRLRETPGKDILEKKWKAELSVSGDGKKVPKVQLTSESIGGADNGSWTSWTCDDMRKILRDGGFKWTDGDPVEVCSIQI